MSPLNFATRVGRYAYLYPQQTGFKINRFHSGSNELV